VKPDAYNGPVPSEGQFRDFARRLIRVPKHEIDQREKARKTRRNAPKDDMVDSA
jgi:hypothetical protein